MSFFKFAGRVLRWRSPENLQILRAGLVRAWCGPGNPVAATGLLPQSCCGNRIAPANPVATAGLP